MQQQGVRRSNCTQQGGHTEKCDLLLSCWTILSTGSINRCALVAADSWLQLQPPQHRRSISTFFHWLRSYAGSPCTKGSTGKAPMLQGLQSATVLACPEWHCQCTSWVLMSGHHMCVVPTSISILLLLRLHVAACNLIYQCVCAQDSQDEILVGIEHMWYPKIGTPAGALAMPFKACKDYGNLHTYRHERLFSLADCAENPQRLFSQVRIMGMFLLCCGSWHLKDELTAGSAQRLQINKSSRAFKYQVHGLNPQLCLSQGPPFPAHGDPPLRGCRLYNACVEIQEHKSGQKKDQQGSPPPPPLPPSPNPSPAPLSPGQKKGIAAHYGLILRMVAWRKNAATVAQSGLETHGCSLLLED